MWAAVGMYTNGADPNNGAVLRSADKGNTWQTTVLPFTLGGNMNGRGMGERLAVDPVNDNVLYLGAPSGNGLWRSTDGGASWARVTSFPHSGDNPQTAGTAEDPGLVWVTFDPTTGSQGTTRTIYVGVADPTNPVYRSTDGGATWSRIWDWGAWPTRTLRYTIDSSATPWMTMGGQTSPPIYVPNVGQVISSLEIDPFNSDRMLYNGGTGVAGTANLTAWDSGGTITITPVVDGLEEGAVQGLIKPPGGPLVSALGDVGGFRHDNLDTAQRTIFTGPVFTTTRSIDYAEQNPRVIVRAGDFSDSDRPGDSHAAFSTDGGATWFQGTEPSGVNSGGSIAAAADGSRFVWAPGDSGQPVVHSVGFGTSWAPSAGVPANAIITSDRVNPMKFYAYNNGTFYVSTNGGANFTATAATGLPATNWNLRVKAVPGREGDIWVAGGATWTSHGLWRSTDSGTTFTPVSSVQNADNIGFGKPAPGGTYPALYAAAQVGGQRGVFRSDDTGQSWVRINDDQHQFGGLPEALTGDPDVYGRVYLTGFGRGIVYGDQTGQ